MCCRTLTANAIDEATVNVSFHEHIKEKRSRCDNFSIDIDRHEQINIEWYLSECSIQFYSKLFC